jgi:hypothetical protein
VAVDALKVGEGAHSCRFEIFMAESRPASEPSPFAFAKASLIRQAGSDWPQFLTDLGPELGRQGIAAPFGPGRAAAPQAGRRSRRPAAGCYLQWAAGVRNVPPMEYQPLMPSEGTSS